MTNLVKAYGPAADFIEAKGGKSAAIRQIRQDHPEKKGDGKYVLSEYAIAKYLGIIPQFVNNVLKKERDKAARKA